MSKSSSHEALAGQVVFITGGASGIGLATGRKLAEQGCTLALVDRNGEQAVEAAASIGTGHIGIEADVTDLASLERAAETTVRELGKIDVVIANAGIGSASTVRASTAEQLLRIIDINLSGQIRTIKATMEYVIAQQGFFAFTCSASVLKNTPKSSAYAAAKAGVEAFAGALRQELMHRGVGVGVFYPGWTPTPLLQGPGSRGGASKSLPWPLSITNELDEVAAAYADAVGKRKRTAYLPKIHRVVHWLRPFYTNGLWDRSQRNEVERNVAIWEAGFLAAQEVSPSTTGNPASS